MHHGRGPGTSSSSWQHTCPALYATPHPNHLWRSCWKGSRVGPSSSDTTCTYPRPQSRFLILGDPGRRQLSNSPAWGEPDGLSLWGATHTRLAASTLSSDLRFHGFYLPYASRLSARPPLRCPHNSFVSRYNNAILATT